MTHSYVWVITDESGCLLGVFSNRRKALRVVADYLGRDLFDWEIEAFKKGWNNFYNPDEHKTIYLNSVEVLK